MKANYYYKPSDEKPGKHDRHHDHQPSNGSKSEYRKLAYVYVSVLVASFLLAVLRDIDFEIFLSSFMAVFLVVFGSFKLYGLETFAMGYRNYDIIAQKFKVWGWIYPLIQIGLGLTYLLFVTFPFLNFVMILIAAVSSVGVYKELERKSNFQCVCLGNFVKLPISRISLVEDLTMLITALIMLFL